LKRSVSLTRVLRCCLFMLSALQIAALLCAWEQPARAYIDPGSGFVFLQIAGSMVAGAVYYLRHRVRRIFVRKSNQVATSGGAPSEVVENQP
jgi:hypothetical protein